MVHRRNTSEENRAAQFAPFAALQGYTRYLEEAEENLLCSEKRDISEEEIEENSRVLMKLRRGMRVKVFYHNGFMDVTETGTITDIELAFHWLKLDGEQIVFEDIYSIKPIFR